MSFCWSGRTILGEYAGAVLGAISTLLFSRSGIVWRRVSFPTSSCLLNFLSVYRSSMQNVTKTRIVRPKIFGLQFLLIERIVSWKSSNFMKVFISDK